jgi:hypothetical protein
VAVALLVALVPALLAALVTEAASGTGAATSDEPDPVASPAVAVDAAPDGSARVEGEPVDAWPFGRDGGS